MITDLSVPIRDQALHSIGDVLKIDYNASISEYYFNNMLFQPKNGVTARHYHDYSAKDLHT
jgi:hypothetical protein